MALDTARAVMYLHAIDIVHCDIKSANLLVDKNWVVKVCDFGLSRKVSGGLADGLNSMQGTFRWMAPELLRRWLMTGPDKLSNEPVTKQMDVYSFGVVMWELFTNQEPWKGFTFQQVTNMVALQKGKLEVPSYVDDTVGTLINSCLSNDPNLRPRFAEIVGVLRVRTPPLPNASKVFCCESHGSQPHRHYTTRASSVCISSCVFLCDAL